MVKVKVNFVMILTFLCQDSVSCSLCCETQPKEKGTSRECTTSTKGLTETQVGCGHSCTSCSIQNSERAVITQEWSRCKASECNSKIFWKANWPALCANNPRSSLASIQTTVIQSKMLWYICVHKDSVQRLMSFWALKVTRLLSFV